jgi:CMP-N-acetylneuraminic acid synthetase
MVAAKMTERAIAIIPARGGSRRIPKKNIKMLCDQPLIAYTIKAAIESDLFSRIVVSTDSEEIAGIARQYGAEVPFLRKAMLADDFTPVSEVTSDALLLMDPAGGTFTSVAQLMANCPLRTSGDVKNSYDLFQNTDSDSQISMVRYGWQNPWWAMVRNERQEIEPLFKEKMMARSQDLPELFCPTGAIWWAKAATLRRTRTFHVDGRTGWEIPWQRGIDIDTFDDYAVAEILLKLPQDPADSGKGS